MGGLQLLILVSLLHTSLTCDYIQFGQSHTMCQYTGQGCKVLKSVFSNAEKAEAVKAHNLFRQKVANGQQNGQPGASNMKEVSWDDEVAKIAQRWADQCYFGHDSNRRSMNYPYVGQNVFIYWSTNYTPMNVTYGVKSWYDEVVDPGFDKNLIKPFRFDYGSGHYTQVVWADTEVIGCGFSTYISRGMYTTLIVCNYGPGGNMLGASMYETGPACSKCNSGRCSETYSGLCIA